MAEHLALQRAWARRDAPHDVQAQFRRYLDNQSVPMPVLHEVFEVFDEPEAAVGLRRRAAREPMYRGATRQWHLAVWIAHYEDTDAALSALRKSQMVHSGAEASWLWLPVLSKVRRQTRFKKLVTELGLVHYWRATGNWGRFARPLSGGDFECS